MASPAQLFSTAPELPASQESRTSSNGGVNWSQDLPSLPIERLKSISAIPDAKSKEGILSDEEIRPDFIPPPSSHPRQSSPPVLSDAESENGDVAEEEANEGQDDKDGSEEEDLLDGFDIDEEEQAFLREHLKEAPEDEITLLLDAKMSDVIGSTSQSAFVLPYSAMRDAVAEFAEGLEMSMMNLGVKARLAEFENRITAYAKGLGLGEHQATNETRKAIANYCQKRGIARGVQNDEDSMELDDAIEYANIVKHALQDEVLFGITKPASRPASVQPEIEAKKSRKKRKLAEVVKGEGETAVSGPQMSEAKRQKKEARKAMRAEAETERRRLLREARHPRIKAETEIETAQPGKAKAKKVGSATKRESIGSSTKDTRSNDKTGEINTAPDNATAENTSSVAGTSEGTSTRAERNRRRKERRRSKLAQVQNAANDEFPAVEVPNSEQVPEDSTKHPVNNDITPETAAPLPAPTIEASKGFVDLRATKKKKRVRKSQFNDEAPAGEDGNKQHADDAAPAPSVKNLPVSNDAQPKKGVDRSHELNAAKQARVAEFVEKLVPASPVESGDVEVNDIDGEKFAGEKQETKGKNRRQRKREAQKARKDVGTPNQTPVVPGQAGKEADKVPAEGAPIEAKPEQPKQAGAAQPLAEIDTTNAPPKSRRSRSKRKPQGGNDAQTAEQQPKENHS